MKYRNKHDFIQNELLKPDKFYRDQINQFWNVELSNYAESRIPGSDCGHVQVLNEFERSTKMIRENGIVTNAE